MLSTSGRAAILGQFISYYMNNDTNVHNNLTFMMDAIVTRSLLKDPEQESEEMTTTRRKWTTRLNSLLQSKQHTARWSAIVLIKLTCDQSPSLLFAHIRPWTNQLLGLVAKSETSMVHNAAIETLSQLFLYTSNKPELVREITVPNLSRFNQSILSLCGKSTDLLAAGLLALKTNFIHFPSQTRHVTDQCLKLCLSCLDGSTIMEKDIILAACQCLVASHHTAGKQNNAEPWKDTLLQLIGSVHKSLDRIFDTIDEELELSERPPSYPFADFSPDPLESFPLIVRRIQSLNAAIATCLGSPTSIVVSVPAVQLVDLACRVYNVFDGSLIREFKDKTEYDCLMSCLPTLHLSTNKIITALLLSSGSHLANYSKLFSRILIRLLTEYKSQRTLKISAYRIISLCLQQFGYIFGESVCKPLVASIIEDIQVTGQKVTDVAPTEVKNKSMKRKRDTLTNSDMLATAGLSTQGPHDIQMAALDALQDLLTCFGSTMDMNSRNTVDAKVLSRLLQFTQKSLESTTEIDILIKEKLYQCLLASIMNPIEVQASILPHALRIFSAGINEQNHQLQSICKQGLAICNLIIHPRMPPIQSSGNTFAAKLKQAEESNQNISTATTSHYPTTDSTVSATLPSTAMNTEEVVTQITDSPQQHHNNGENSAAAVVVNDRDAAKQKMSMMEQEIESVFKANATQAAAAAAAAAAQAANFAELTSTTTTTTMTNEIRLDDNDLVVGDENDVVMEQEEQADITTTTTSTAAISETDAPTTTTVIDQTSDFTAVDMMEIQPGTEKPNKVRGDSLPPTALVLDDSDDMLDGDLTLPDIDMAGPDTDDEGEW
ncbi:rRNA processing/ribosome biogenesis-domain-containing protein [Absidia repens]|uniref:Pre-rRNA-processing protein RIX1 n=1 Tax=Absidia repens TaxID=90262 RepID=A0A1X2I5F9_9FUNG|nr:rRNA processing/ribosome biogenesis-domain-containing protein [Absidia repens]